MHQLMIEQLHHISGGTITLDYSSTSPTVVTITIDNKHDILHMNNFMFTRDNCYYNGIPVDSSSYNIKMTKHDRHLFWWHSWTSIEYVLTGDYV